MESSKLEEWLAAEAVQRQLYDRGVGPGVATPAQVAPLDGLGIMRAMMRGDAMPSIRVPQAPQVTTT